MNRAFRHCRALLFVTNLGWCLTSVTRPAIAADPKSAPAKAPSAEASSAAPTSAQPAPEKPAPEKAPAEPSPQTSAPPTAATPAAPSPSSTEASSNARPAPEQVQAAKQAFADGEAALSSSNFAEAEAKFRQANALVPTPHAEYWIAVAMDKQVKPAKEVYAAYELFLNHPAREHVGKDELAAAQARAAALKATLPASITVETTPAGAHVKVDGVVIPGVTPLDVDMDPGSHRLELTLSGYETSLVELDAEAGARVRAPVELVKAKVAPPVALAAVAQDKKRNIVPAVVTLSLAGAGLISGTIFGILALDSKSDFDQNPTEAKADEAERNALIADMSFGIALTLGITGIVLLTTEDDGVNPAQTGAAAPKRTVHFAPFASPTAGGAVFSGTF